MNYTVRFLFLLFFQFYTWTSFALCDVKITSVDVVQPTGQDSNGEITVVATGGQGTITFQITNSLQNETGTFTQLPRGYYFAKAKDENGCTDQFPNPFHIGAADNERVFTTTDTIDFFQYSLDATTKRWTTNTLKLPLSFNGSGMKKDTVYYLQTDAFNLHKLKAPRLSISHKKQYSNTYAYIEYSTNGGISWTKMPAPGIDFSKPYNVDSQCWSNIGSWDYTSTFPLADLKDESNLVFRFCIFDSPLSTKPTSSEWVINSFAIDDMVCDYIGYKDADFKYFEESVMLDQYHFPVSNSSVGSYYTQYTVDVYLSRDTIIDGSDLSLNRFKSSTGTISSPPQQSGNYYLLFSIDPDNTVAETNKSNNLGYTCIHIANTAEVPARDNVNSNTSTLWYGSDDWKRIEIDTDNYAWYNPIEKPEGGSTSYGWESTLKTDPINLNGKVNQSLCFKYSKFYKPSEFVMPVELLVSFYDKSTNWLNSYSAETDNTDCMCFGLDELYTAEPFSAELDMSSLQYDVNGATEIAFDDLYIGDNLPYFVLLSKDGNHFGSQSELSDSLYFTVYNQGNAEGSAAIDFYVSKDSIFSRDDVLSTRLDNLFIPVKSKADTVVAISKSIPLNSTYYVFGIVDPENKLEEVWDDTQRITRFTIRQKAEFKAPYFNSFEVEVNGWSIPDTNAIATWKWIEQSDSINVPSGKMALVENPCKFICKSDDYLKVVSPIIDISTLKNPVLHYITNQESYWFNTSYDYGNTFIPTEFHSNPGLTHNLKGGFCHRFVPLGKNDHVLFEFYQPGYTNKYSIIDNFAVEEAKVALMVLNTARTEVSELSQTLELNHPVYNGGNYPCKNALVKYYLSVDNTLDAADIIIGEGGLPRILPDGTQIITRRFPMPKNAKLYHYVLCTIDKDTTDLDSYEFSSISRSWPFAVGNVRQLPYYNGFDTREQANDWYVECWNADKTLDEYTAGFEYYPADTVSIGGIKSSWGRYGISDKINYLESPEMDLSHSDIVKIEFGLFVRGYNSRTDDGASFEVSTDGGNTWFKLKDSTAYNSFWASASVFTGSSIDYMDKMIHPSYITAELRGQKNVKFRFRYRSKSFNNDTNHSYCQLDYFSVKGIETETFNLSAVQTVDTVAVAFTNKTVKMYTPYICLDGYMVKYPNIKYYLSEDKKIDISDIYIGKNTDAFPKLCDFNGGFSSVYYSLDLSPYLEKFPSSPLYLIAHLDADNYYPEQDETDNYHYTYLDLRYNKNDVAAFNGLYKEVPFVNGSTLKMEPGAVGKTGIAYSAFSVKTYLSKDSIFDGADILLDTYINDTIQPSKTESRTCYVSRTMTIPASFVPEQEVHWTFISVNEERAFEEDNYTNNVTRVPIKFKQFSPDLVVQSIATIQPSADLIWVHYKVVNEGLADAPACKLQYDIYYFPSSNDEIKIQLPAIPAKSFVYDSVQAGRSNRNYVHFEADCDNEVAELNEGNNIGYTRLVLPDNSSDFSINRSLSDTLLLLNKDLTSAYFYIYKHADDCFRDNFPLDIDFYFSTSSDLDKTGKVASRVTYESGPSGRQYVSLNIPQDLNSGHYFIHYIVDPDEKYLESDESNNTGSIEVFVKENSYDISIKGGLPQVFYKQTEEIKVCDTVVHSGIPTDEQFVVSYFTSADNKLDEKDQLIAESVQIQLDSAERLGICTTVTLPKVLPAAEFYILSHVDYNRRIFDNYRFNNTGANMVTLKNHRFVSVCGDTATYKGITDPGVHILDHYVYKEIIHITKHPEYLIEEDTQVYCLGYLPNANELVRIEGKYAYLALKSEFGCDSIRFYNIYDTKHMIVEDTIISGPDISAFIVDGVSVGNKNTFSDKGNSIADNPFGIYNVALDGVDPYGCYIDDTVVVIPKQCNVLKAYEIGTDSVCGPCSQIANRSNLVNQIDKAETLLENAVVGGAIGQYPQSAVDALSANIVLAYKDLKNINLDQPAIDNSVLVLKEAVFAFEASKILPAINMDKLNLSIANATLAVDSAKAGTNPGEYPAASIEALHIELDKATAVLGQTGVTQEKIDNAVVALDLAIFNFEKTKVTLSIQTVVLTKRILEAEAIVANSEYGTAPGMYPIVAKDLLQKSIASVNSGLKTATSQEDIDSLLSALNEAIAEFEASKIIFVAGSAVELAKTIALAQELTSSAVVGDKTGQFPQAALDKLNKAVNDAKQYTVNEYSQETIDSAQKVLSTAVAEFEASKIGFVAGSTDELAKTIALAEELIGSAVVGDKAGQFSQAALDKLNKAVNDAKQYTVNEYSQETIDNAQKALSSAVAEFEASKIIFIAGSAVELAKTIALAQELTSSAVVGDKTGQFPQAALDKLNKAVNDAKPYTVNEYSQETIDSAQKVLSTAVAEFEASKIGFVAGSAVELAKTIALAEELAGSSIVGDKAGQFPQAALDKLNKAVNDAKPYTVNEYSQETIDSAQKVLSTAVAEFEASKIGFVAGSAVELAKTIALAEELTGSAVVGDKTGQFPQTALDKLNKAVNDAKPYTVNEYSQETIDSAQKVLSTAVAEFEASKIGFVAGSAVELSKTIALAEELAGSAVVGDKTGQFPQAALDKLNKAVNDAKQYTVNECSQETIDSAQKVLSTAVAEFEASKIGFVAGSTGDLLNAIILAERVFGAAVVGTNVGQYPQSALDKLSVAIVNAKQYTKNEYSQESIDNAIKALGTAIFDFEKCKVSIIAGSTSTLREKIDLAMATYESIKGNTLTQTEIDAFNKVIVSADQFMLVEHTQSDIDSVVKTVVAAQQKLESINAKLLELKGLIQNIKKAIEIAENRGSADVIKLNNTLRDAEKVDLTAITSDELSALVTELTDALAEYESKPNKLSVRNVQNETFIYPNPGKDNIKIFLDGFVGQKITLEIKSVGGQLFYYGYFNVERPSYVFDASTYIPGAYIVNISNGIVSKSEKLIIE